MTLAELRRKVSVWDLSGQSGPRAGSKYSAIMDQLDFNAKGEWGSYTPTEHPDFNSDLMERLARWVGSAPNEDDQRLLLEYATYISYFSQSDFTSLYQTAMQKEVMRWIAQNINANLTKMNLQKFNDFVYREAYDHTWFCPITDSMNINEFYKVNHIGGKRHRPHFDTLSGQPQSKAWACEEMEHHKLRHLVLLEDMVGSGTQCGDAIQWALDNLPSKILFIPLILCPNGEEKFNALVSSSNGRLSVRPVIRLQRSDLLGVNARRGAEGWPITEELERFITNHSPIIFPGLQPFGYKNTGCSVVMFSNTPDNTPPIVYKESTSSNWQPLFVRVYRD